MIDQKDINELMDIIENNQNIDIVFKQLIKENVELLVRKCPIAYNNLYINLQTITIKYANEYEELELRKKGVDSNYKAYQNILLFNKNIPNNLYQHLTIHELLHVSSFNGEKMGFLSFDEKGGSLNEGMTEYLTQLILGTKDVMLIYKTECDNIKLISNIVPIKKFVNLYFTEGMLGFYKEYGNKVGINNINNLIDAMDNSNQEEFIKIIFQDITNFEFNTINELKTKMFKIYKTLTDIYGKKNIPNNIQEIHSNSIRKIFSKFKKQKGIK